MNDTNDLKENRKEKIIAVLLALLVTFLWSTSFIIIKNGLNDIPPITFAGLRYFIASIALLPIICKKKKIEKIKNINKKNWKLLIILGLMFYTVTQGTQFIGLSLISTVTVSLMLNFTPLVVALMGMIILNEKPNVIQGIGIVVFIIGILLYFKPFNNLANEKLGILIMIIGVLANAISSILGRKINMNKEIDPVIITFISMLIGAVTLLTIGIIKDGIIKLDIRNIIYLLWLSVINTALAFTLWNVSLRTLTAMESSIINGTMLIQIAILSVIFLDMEISYPKMISLLIVATGAILVQIKKTYKKN